MVPSLISMPELIPPAAQVNMQARHLAAPGSNGTRYPKIPIDRL
jgi:hypothetical protein